LPLLVGRLPTGVVRVGLLVGTPVLAEARARAPGRHPPLLFLRAGLRPALLLSAAVLLVCHGLPPPAGGAGRAPCPPRLRRVVSADRVPVAPTTRQGMVLAVQRPGSIE